MTTTQGKLRDFQSQKKKEISGQNGQAEERLYLSSTSEIYIAKRSTDGRGGGGIQILVCYI